MLTTINLVNLRFINGKVVFKSFEMSDFQFIFDFIIFILMSAYKILKAGTLILNKYRIIEEVGSGSFGTIFSAEDIEQHIFVAIKVESMRVKHPQLETEYKVYTNFTNTTHFPNVYQYSTEGDHRFLVIDLLGKSIESKFQKLRNPMSLKTVLMLADQMITAIEYLHKKSFIHRDLKPDNFMLGTGNNANEVYLIDFGLSRNYRSQITHKHKEFNDDLSLVGTPRYASINALKGYEQSRRDDMESLGYIWMYLLRGSLPWQGLPAAPNQKYAKILDVKEHTPLTELCKGFPHEFADYLREVRSLSFTEEPNYAKYRAMFRNLFIRSGFTYDYQYDWLIPVKEPTIPRPPNTQPTTPKRSMRHIIPSTNDSSNNNTKHSNKNKNSQNEITSKHLPVLSPRNKEKYNPFIYNTPIHTSRGFITKQPKSPRISEDSHIYPIEKRKVIAPKTPTARKSIRNYTFRRGVLYVE